MPVLTDLLRMARAFLIWAYLGLALVLPLIFVTMSEYLAWRDPVYITAGLAGVVALGLVLVQPLLAQGWLPGLHMLSGRRRSRRRPLDHQPSRHHRRATAALANAVFRLGG